MKNLFTFCLMLLFCCEMGSLQAQLACNNNVNVSLGPLGDAYIIPEDILEGNNIPSGCKLSVDGGTTYVDTIFVSCDDIGSFDVEVYDPAADLSCWSTVIVEDKLAPIAIVESDTLYITLDNADDIYTLSVEDMDDGSYDNCSPVTLSLSQSEFTIDDLGENQVSLIATDVSDNSSYAYRIVFVNYECGFTDTAISWPDSTLQIDGMAIDTINAFTPAELITEYSFEEHQVQPTFPPLIADCPLQFTYSDEYIFSEGNTIMTIVRTFTVIYWTDNTTYTFTQLIRVSFSDAPYICDFLPHTAPVGDCASGHTLEDDVEWPADISISDHRILPDQLEQFSNVDTLDSSPTFYADGYEASYLDLLDSLNSSAIYLNRRWEVSHPGFPDDWYYNQKLTIDISDFNELVSVEDPTGEGLSGVLINNSLMTNDEGILYTDQEVDSITKEDDSRDGLDIIDYTMIYEHILSISQLSEIQQQVADINQNGVVTTLDLVLLQKYVAGEELSGFDYQFTEQNDALASVMNASYMGFKPGDVDFSRDESSELIKLDDDVFLLEDILLNEGEQYNVPITLGKDLNMISYDLLLSIDPTKVEVLDIVYEEDDKFIKWSQSENHIRVMAALANDGTEIFNSEEVVGHLVIKAKKNTVLSNTITLSEKAYALDQDHQLMEVNVSITEQIPNKTLEVKRDLFKVYPNPAVSSINISLNDPIADYTISLRNMNGTLIYKSANVDQVNLEGLATGIYVVELVTDTYVSREKLMIVR